MNEHATEDRAYQFALLYDNVVVPRYAQLFADLMLAAVEVPARANVLDLACRTGFASAQILASLFEGRIVAVDDDPAFLDLARVRAGEEVGRRFFLKEESVESLPFGESVFTNVVGNLVDRVTTDRGRMMSEVARVLRPEGQLVLTMPLRGSFAEVVDIFREVAQKHDLAGVTERVEQYQQSLPTAEAWITEVESHGFSAAAVTEQAFVMPFESGNDVLVDPAMQIAAVPEWQWVALGSNDPDTVLWRVQEALSTYFHGRMFDLTVLAGCITARRSV